MHFDTSTTPENFYSHEHPSFKNEKFQTDLKHVKIEPLLGQPYVYIQRPSQREPERFCNIFVKPTGFLGFETSIICNPNAYIRVKINKAIGKITHENKEQYPLLFELLRPGGDYCYDEGKIKRKLPDGITLVFKDKLIKYCIEFFDFVEQMYVELQQLDDDKSTVQALATKGKTSSSPLYLFSKEFGDVEFRYRERQTSAFWGTKYYDLQIVDNGEIVTALKLTWTSMLDPKFQFKTPLKQGLSRNFDTLTQQLTRLDYEQFRPKIKELFPTLYAFLFNEGYGTTVDFNVDELKHDTDIPFTFNMNREIPDSVFGQVLIYQKFTDQLINDVLRFRKTPLYRALLKRQTFAEEQRSKALLSRLTVIGIGAMLSTSLDFDDSGLGDLSTDGDISDLLGDGANADVDVATPDVNVPDTPDIPDTPDAPAVAANPPASRPMMYGNPWSGGMKADDMVNMMHQTGQISDNDLSLYNSMCEGSNRISEQTAQMHKDLMDSFHEDLAGARNNPIGPSPDDWNRFDEFESQRADAVSAYQDALKHDNFDEAAKQAEIARNAQYGKDGIYNPGYVTDIDVRAGLAKP